MQAPILRTERLVIRPLLSEDIDAFARELTSNPEIMKNLSEQCATPAEERECASQYIEGYSSLWDTHNYGGWAVCARINEIAEPGTFLGYAGFGLGQLKGAELSYALGQAHWEKGIANEAAKACLDWFFRIAGHEHCYVCHHSWNESSKRTIEKLGFVFSRMEDLWGGVAKGDGLLPTYLLDRKTYLGRELA